MKTSGKLIVIEGVDGSGKETQTGQLYDHLCMDGVTIKKVAYPRYDKDSSAMVRHYLAGDYGTDPSAISPYVASTFYAADRYASYKEDYEDFLADGGIVLADRYTTSNMVHQAGKIADADERQAFLDWLVDYEFNLLGLPMPDLVFFLDIPPAINEQLMADRANKMTGGTTKDIHEADTNYLRQAYTNARELAENRGWTRIDCCDADGKLRSIESIHEQIYGIVVAMIDGDTHV